MSTPRQTRPLDADLIDPALRLEAELDALNTRIARLALLLHAPLGDADGLHRIMERDPAFFPVHPVASAVEAGRVSGHRLAHEWEELRGLIVLRYELIVQAVRDFGVERTRQMASVVERDLERQGFGPGSDGFDLVQ